MRARSKSSKGELVKARVSASMKREIVRLAISRDESEAVVIRAALKFYIESKQR